MKPELQKKVYFLGIGGIGMSALARYLNTAGVKVSGYDRTCTPLTQELEEEGIDIHYNDNPDGISRDFELVVYTPAIPEDLGEFQRVVEMQLPLMKRSQFLEVITGNHKTIAVAGTHGKTTVSTMIAHTMFSSSLGCTAFLGGIAKNYNSNLLLNHKSSYMVAEADEFDRSFLRLHPVIAVITSTDADHLDIYGNHESLLKSFTDFAGNIQQGGTLILKSGVTLDEDSNSFDSKSIKRYTYSVVEEADFCVQDLVLDHGKYKFSLKTPNSVIDGFRPALPGLFNVENSVAAAAAAWSAGVSNDEIVKAINSFKGVRRRFDHVVEKPDLLYIDDYAHHPEELKACITSVRKLYPSREITGIFQPHLYTRTRDFAEGFAESLSLLDRLILLDIYPARELPIEGVTSAMLLNMIPLKEKRLIPKNKVIDYLKTIKPDILLTLGAGDIDQLVPMIEQLYK